MGGSSTIFLAVGDGYQARTLLHTRLFETLKAHVGTLVVLVPNPDETYLREELSAPNVVLEDFQPEGAAAYMARNPLQNVLRGVRNYALEIGKARALNDKASWRMPTRSRRLLVRKGTDALIWLCQRSGLVRRALVAAEDRLTPASFCTPLFERYRPDLVVTGVPGYYPHDTLLLREAKHRGVLTAAVITSWDAPHNMGLAGARPDYVVVWSDVQKEEMVFYQGLRPERIFVGGVPPFDVYKRSAPWPSRDEVFSHYGLDPGRKLIVFATKSPSVYLHVRIMEMLVQAIEENRFSFPAQLLVRLHPHHFATLMANSPALTAIMGEYHALQGQTAHLKFSTPKVMSSKLDTDMPGEAQVLADLFQHTDVLVTLFSTIQLEACLADVPVVNVAFDPPQGDLPDGYSLRPRDARLGYRLRPIAVDIGQPQNQRVGPLGATRQASSEEDLMRLIDRYLQDPTLEAEERRRLVSQECGPTDGHAGERIGQYLMGLLRTPRRSTVGVAPE